MGTDPSRARRSRLRCRQAGDGAQATQPGGRRGAGAPNDVPARRHPGLGRRRVSVPDQQARQPAAGAGLGRQRLQAERAARAGGADLRLETGGYQPPRGGAGLRDDAPLQRGGVEVRLAGAQPSPDQGVRGVDRDDRGVVLRRHDPPHAPPPHRAHRLNWLPKQALNIDGTKQSGSILCGVPIPAGLFEREAMVNCGRSMLRYFQMSGETPGAKIVSDCLLLTC